MYFVNPLFLTRTIIVLLFLMTQIENVRAENLLGGQAFTDPSQQTPMSKQWLEQSLQYPHWAQAADLAITLDQQLYPVLLPIIQQYAREKQLDIAVQEGTCGTSAKGLTDKTVDIAGFCCPPSLVDRLPTVKFHTLGIGAIALFVHPTNPITNLTLEQARQIFGGHLFRWSEVKTDQRFQGARKIIQVIGRLHCKQRPGHWRLLLDNEDLFSPRMLEVSTIPDMISEVAHDPNAIGYETLWMLKQYQQQDNVKILSIDHVHPKNNQKLVANAYPLYRTFNLTTWESKPVKSVQAQDLVKHLLKAIERVDPKYGIVPVSQLRQASWLFLEDEVIGEPK